VAIDNHGTIALSGILGSGDATARCGIVKPGR
jgi:hypothetical protein